MRTVARHGGGALPEGTGGDARLPLPAWLVWVVLATLGALLMTTYRYLAGVSEGYADPLLEVVVAEFTGVFGGALLVPVVVVLVRRFPLGGDRWASHALVHLAALVVLSAAHTTLNWASRSVLFPVLGLGAYDYGVMPVRYLMEAPIDVILYALTVVITGLVDRYATARDRELRVTRLEGQLAEARLERLRGQLHPHFLFNTLNTVSSVMYDDVERADRMLSRLGELLRWTLDDERGPEVTLAEELGLLERYLEIMRARHGASLVVTVDVPEALAEQPVPALLLQPLVENALRHGAPSGRGDAHRVEVTARAAGPHVELAVRDHGPGWSGALEAARGRGIGLRNTVERIRTLYGEAGELALKSPSDGGLRVVVRLPRGTAREAFRGRGGRGATGLEGAPLDGTEAEEGAAGKRRPTAEGRATARRAASTPPDTLPSPSRPRT